MRVLLVVHGFPPAAAGGTEIYVHDLARALAAGGDEVFVLAREAAPERPEYDVRAETRGNVRLTLVNRTFRDAWRFEDTYRSPAVGAIAGRLAGEVRADVAHVHHLTGLGTDVVFEIARRGIPVVVTLNDYWLICHRGQLLDRDGRRCEAPAGCGRCLGAAGRAPRRADRAWRALARWLPPGAAAGPGRRPRVPADLADPEVAARALDTRVRHMRELAGVVTHFLAPSRTLRERFLGFGIAGSRITLQEQGIDQSGFRGLVRTPADRLRLGFLGSLMTSKAPHLLLEAYAGLPRGAASVRLYGAYAPYHGDDAYRARLAPLLALPGVHHAGPIPHAEAPGALASLDALVVPSVWIENAPFVIREAFAAGVPVVASRLGGMAELVTHERSGLLFEPGDAADLGRALRRLLDEPDLLPRLRAGLPRVRAIEADAAQIRWGQALPSRPSGIPAAGRPGWLSLESLTPIVVNFGTPDDTLLAVRSLEASRRAVEPIVVDNGSADGSAAILRAALPGRAVIRTERNLGFAGGANVGIRRALDRGAALVLLVNSDVIVPPDAIGRLEAGLGAHPEAGLAGPVILSRAEPERVLSMGISFSPVTGRLRDAGHGARFAALGPPATGAVDAVSGACMLVRREVLERVGLLAEEYFFGLEDLDLCLRARAAGYLTLLVGGAVVYHEGSRSIGARSPRRLYFAARNHLLLARRAAPRLPPSLGLARSGSIVALNLAHALVTAGTPRLPGLRAVGRGVLDHWRRRYGDGPGRAGRGPA
jgi:GT2 family glycosyltransferase/glycosyltransferase involved in cell wall biosynthesis